MVMFAQGTSPPPKKCYCNHRAWRFVQIMFAGMRAPPPAPLDSRKSLFLTSTTSTYTLKLSPLARDRAVRLGGLIYAVTDPVEVVAHALEQVVPRHHLALPPAVDDDTIGALDRLLGVGKAFALQPKAPKFIEQVAVEAVDNGSYITALVQVDAVTTVNWVGRRAVDVPRKKQ